MNFTPHKQTAGYVLRMERYLSAPTQIWLASRPKPLYLCGCRVPDSLDDLSFGDLMDLQSAGGSHNLVEVIGKVLLKVSPKRIMRAPADQVYGLVLWVGREVARINALFDSIKPELTDDEKKAGIEDLNFGTFGVADWYARRMGMTDQDDALKVKWVRIFKCQENDSKADQYARRLREIITSKKQ